MDGHCKLPDIPLIFVLQTNIDPSCIGSFLQHIYRIAQDLSYRSVLETDWLKSFSS